MTYNEMIAVIAAHRDGKKLECRHAGAESSQWVRVGGIPCWNFTLYDYRIAVEPRRCWVRWCGAKLQVVEFVEGDNTESLNGWQLVIEEVK